jgi:hypothetical protein
MTSHEDVAQAWSEGKSAKGSRMYSNGRTIFSYGSHFPVAHRIKDTVLFNTDKYSSSTSKHQSKVKWHCNKITTSTSNSTFIECTTEEIKRAIDNPEDPIIITKTKEYETINECFERIRQIYKAKGLKRAPIQKAQQMFQQWEIIKQL